MGHHFTLFLSAILILLVYALSAWAQDGANSLDQIPDEYIEEAHNYFERCEADANISSFYDCRCMAGDFLNARIKRGPETSASSIELSLGPGCVDDARIAGVTYNECLGKGPLLPMNQSVEEYCTCYANTFGRVFKASRLELTSINKIRLQVQAGVICENPARGKELYPLAYSLSGIEEQTPTTPQNTN